MLIFIIHFFYIFGMKWGQFSGAAEAFGCPCLEPCPAAIQVIHKIVSTTVKY